MKRTKITYGLISIMLGAILFVLTINMAAKPSNVGISFKPIESIKTYFFAFVWEMGDLGWLIGGILLIAFFTLCYFVGNWVYNSTHSFRKR